MHHEQQQKETWHCLVRASLCKCNFRATQCMAAPPHLLAGGGWPLLEPGRQLLDEVQGRHVIGQRGRPGASWRPRRRRGGGPLRLRPAGLLHLLPAGPGGSDPAQTVRGLTARIVSQAAQQLNGIFYQAQGITPEACVTWAGIYAQLPEKVV